MTFQEVLAQVIDWLQREQRVSYRALKRQFALDEDYLEDLKDAILFAHPVIEEAGRGLVWAGDAAQESTTPASKKEQPAKDQERDPASYTPQHLAEKILTSRSALQGERKQVTVMFADIKDSTELIRDLDPEAAQQLLDPAIHIMMDAVHRFEGTVNQVLGDGIMAIFGAPIAHEDHAARACYAALAMQLAMRAYTEEARRSHGITLQIRVGLNSGEVVVRTITSDLHMDYSAVGTTTHLAARMEQLATPGSIVLSRTTLRLVEGLVRVNDLGPIPVKGVAEPVEVYELTGASTIRRRLQAAVARGLTRFVGRDTEIESLVQALGKAASGHGQVVAAVGEAGVGKSRLVYEFIHSHRTQGWLVLESTSVSYGKATPYFPVVDLLKRYVHVEDGDDPRTVRAKVTGQILTLDENLQETIPPLLSLLDALPEDSPFLQLDPPQRRQRTLDGLKRILLRESQVQSLILVFEDLHWIDSETQALLDSLVDSLPTAQMLLLVNYRPEYQHSWGSKTFYTQLRLDPLPPASAEEFLAGLLGNNSSLEPLKKLLIERTGGNPFFLEESVRTLVETQVLTDESGTYRLAQDIPSIQVPASVQAVLAARMDRLPQDEKRLLQTASVIGTEVPLSLFQAIAEFSEETLYRGLSHLQAAEFLYETSLFPERVYTFKHALTHEVAYGSLLQERRRVLHAHIVDALETIASDRLAEQVERLAYHAFRGEIWDKALDYARQAGVGAMDHSANQEAAASFEQALSALRHLPEQRDTMEQAIDLRLNLYQALYPLLEFGRILESMREAEQLAETLDDQQRLGWISGRIAHVFWTLGDYERAIEIGHRALTLATTLGDTQLEIRSNMTLGYAHYALGNYHQARHFLEKSAVFLEVGQIPESVLGVVFQSAVFPLTWFVWCLTELGMFTEVIAWGEDFMRLAEVTKRPYSISHAYIGLGHLCIRQGVFPRAMMLLERSQVLCRDLNFPNVWIVSAAQLGYVYALSGRLTEALPLLEQAVEQGAAIPGAGYALWNAWLSEAYLRANRMDDAIALGHRALKLVQTGKERGHQAWILHLLGDIAMHRDPPDIKQAETYYQQALALANELGMRPLQAHCHRGLGTLYRQIGQPDQARAELSAAIDMYRDMEMMFWLPETEAALDDVEGKP